MPKYRLSYFNAKGRAELPRMLFVLAWVDFQDKRFTREEWQEYKPKSPYGVMPVLEIEGTPYFQSSGIVRYLARTFGLYGKGVIEELEVDQVLAIVDDVGNTLMKVYYESDQERKEALAREAKEEKVPAFMGMFEKVLKSNGTGFFVGNSITAADVAVFDMMDNVKLVVGDPYEGHPLTKQLVEKVGSNQRIRAWVERQQQKQ